jgi:hypothetical protein
VCAWLDGVLPDHEYPLAIGAFAAADENGKYAILVDADNADWPAIREIAQRLDTKGIWARSFPPGFNPNGR